MADFVTHFADFGWKFESQQLLNAIFSKLSKFLQVYFRYSMHFAFFGQNGEAQKRVKSKLFRSTQTVEPN